MKKILLIFLLAISSLITAQSSNSSNRLKNFNIENNLAIQGYDPVTYFTINKAVKGNPKITSKYKGISYNFSTEANKKLFDKNPEKYEPQYGGWCAYAMGEDGEKVKIDPKTFKVTDGKLYLFYNFYFTNTLKSWNKDEKILTKQADYNWKKIK